MSATMSATQPPRLAARSQSPRYAIRRWRPNTISQNTGMAVRPEREPHQQPPDVARGPVGDRVAGRDDQRDQEPDHDRGHEHPDVRQPVARLHGSAVYRLVDAPLRLLARAAGSSSRRPSSRSGITEPSRSLRRQRRVVRPRIEVGRHASRRPWRPRRRPPSRRRRGGSRSGAGPPSASAAAAKIAGCGLIVPTRSETTIAVQRAAASRPPPTYRSIVAASGQLDRTASRSVRRAAPSIGADVAAARDRPDEGAGCTSSTPHATSSGSGPAAAAASSQRVVARRRRSPRRRASTRTSRSAISTSRNSRHLLARTDARAPPPRPPGSPPARTARSARSCSPVTSTTARSAARGTRGRACSRSRT